MQSPASLSGPISLAVANWLTIPVHKIHVCASVEANVRLLPKNAHTMSSFKSQRKTPPLLHFNVQQGSAVSRSESVTTFHVCVWSVEGTWECGCIVLPPMYYLCGWLCCWMTWVHRMNNGAVVSWLTWVHRMNDGAVVSWMTWVHRMNDGIVVSWMTWVHRMNDGIVVSWMTWVPRMNDGVVVSWMTWVHRMNNGAVVSLHFHLPPPPPPPLHFFLDGCQNTHHC